jgi:hypothetical protein
MATVDDATGLVPDPRGEGGGLFDDPQKIHEDAKLLGQAIRHKWDGIVDPNKVKPLIEKGYQLAENATDPRGYASVMKVIQSFAKLEQDEAKAIEPSGNTTTNVQINGNVSLNDGRTELLGIIAAASERARAAESSGTIDAPADSQPTLPAEPVD